MVHAMPAPRGAGIADRIALVRAARETGIELGQPVAPQAPRRIAQRREDSLCLRIAAVSFEAGELEHVILQQAPRDGLRTPGGGDAAPQHQPAVGSGHLHRPATTLQREHLTAEAVRPEVALEAPAQGCRPFHERLCAAPLPRAPGARH